eukprot:6182748-Pleurochrysis_carterae.AAC.2
MSRSPGSFLVGFTERTAAEKPSSSTTGRPSYPNEDSQSTFSSGNCLAKVRESNAGNTSSEHAHASAATHISPWLQRQPSEFAL